MFQRTLADGQDLWRLTARDADGRQRVYFGQVSNGWSLHGAFPQAVNATCKTHGSFWAEAYYTLSGVGMVAFCPTCSAIAKARISTAKAPKVNHRALRDAGGFVGKWTFLGTDDSINVCDRCGRKNLKATVALEDVMGEIVHYGSECAADALAIPEAAVQVFVRDADRAREAKVEAQRKAEAQSADAARQIELGEFEAWLARVVPHEKDGIARRQALGGHRAAWTRWKAEGTTRTNGRKRRRTRRRRS